MCISRRGAEHAEVQLLYKRAFAIFAPWRENTLLTTHPIDPDDMEFRGDYRIRFGLVLFGDIAISPLVLFPLD